MTIHSDLHECTHRNGLTPECYTCLDELQTSTLFLMPRISAGTATVGFP